MALTKEVIDHKLGQHFISSKIIKSNIMIKKILCSVLVISMISCGSKGDKELMTPSGYKYTHVSTGGEKVEEGDYVSITIVMEGSDGKILQEFGEENMPVMEMPKPGIPLPKPNPVVDMLMNGGLGDSMTLIMPIDSFPNNNNPQLAGLEHIKYVTCIRKIQSDAEYSAYMEEQRLKQEMEVEAGKARLSEIQTKAEETLKAYKTGKLDVNTTEDGLKYVIHSPGDGPQGEAGKQASVHYYGCLMDGKMFDSSFLRGSPYPFRVGTGSVIKGWDLGIPLLKKGGSATLFIPYTLAYGEAGKPPTIPEKAELMFYVELVDVL